MNQGTIKLIRDGIHNREQFKNLIRRMTFVILQV
jgi:hypothetical protein